MSTTAAASPALLPARALDRIVIAAAIGLVALGTVHIATGVSANMAGTFLIGGLLGLTLYQAAFGFTGGWRAFVTEGRGAGLRAQVVMLALATAIFLPLLAAAPANGWGLGGFVVPVSGMLVAGAFLFGIGMQLGGGCGSGTLFTVGGGSARMVFTLVFFIVGSMVGVVHVPLWSALPSLGAHGLVPSLGLVPAMALQFGLLALLYLVVARSERRRRGALQPLGAGTRASLATILKGPWPILWGAVLLALFGALFLLNAGHPWGITSAFPFWGGKIATALGLPVEEWAGQPGVFGDLSQSIFSHRISVADLGLVLGAMLGAGLAGKFAPKVDLSAGSLAAAAIGGLMMGYGARLSSGCNIGALFGGIASGSLHGWVWFAVAYCGSLVGIRARRLFGI